MRSAKGAPEPGGLLFLRLLRFETSLLRMLIDQLLVPRPQLDPAYFPLLFDLEGKL